MGLGAGEDPLSVPDVLGWGSAQQHSVPCLGRPLPARGSLELTPSPNTQLPLLCLEGASRVTWGRAGLPLSEGTAGSDPERHPLSPKTHTHS